MTYFQQTVNAFFRSAAAGPFFLCGQNSLHVFCLGVFLSFAGLIAIVEVSNSIPFQILVNLVGILAMVATAGVLAWYKAKERAPRRAMANQQALGGSSAE